MHEIGTALRHRDLTEAEGTFDVAWIRVMDGTKQKHDFSETLSLDEEDAFRLNRQPPTHKEVGLLLW